jgi:hypothetical protein
MMTRHNLSYLIYGKAGYGHAARLVAILRALNNRGNFAVGVFANDAVWPVLYSVASSTYTWLKSFDYLFREDPTSPGSFENQEECRVFFETNKEHLNEWKESVIFTDFVKHAVYIKQCFGAPLLGLTHSDLIARRKDTSEVANWKNFIQQTIDKCDVVFQSTILPEQQTIANVIPVPIISRKPTCTIEQLKTRIGLPDDEQFILYYPGVEKGPKRYPHLDDVQNALAELQLPFRVVVMHGIHSTGQKPYTDNFGCIHVYNEQEGQNFVNAASFVIAKPGMSLFSECIATRTPILMCHAATGETLVREEMYRQVIGSKPPILGEFDKYSMLAAIENLVDQSSCIRDAFGGVRSDGDQVVANMLIEAMAYLSNFSSIDGLLEYLRSIAPQE